MHAIDLPLTPGEIKVRAVIRHMLRRGYLVVAQGPRLPLWDVRTLMREVGDYCRVHDIPFVWAHKLACQTNYTLALEVPARDSYSDEGHAAIQQHLDGCCPVWEEPDGRSDSFCLRLQIRPSQCGWAGAYHKFVRARSLHGAATGLYELASRHYRPHAPVS